MLKKNNYTHGFLLLDIMVALALSAVLLMGLYQSLFQTTRLTRHTEQNADMALATAIFYNQLEKDIAGIFYPEHDDTDKKDKKEEHDEQLFVGSRDGEEVYFSCMTTTVLPVYEQDIARCARVMYKIVPRKKREKITTHKIVRQESATRDIKQFRDTKKIRAYTIIDSLKNCAFKYMVFVEDKESKKQIVESFDVWNAEIQKKTGRKIPDFIEILGVFINTSTQKEYPFVYKFSIPVHVQKKSEDKENQKNSVVNNTIAIGATPVAPQKGAV